MTAPVLLARAALAVLSDKKSRKWLLLLIFAPILLLLFAILFLPAAVLSGVVLLLNPSGDELVKDPYYIAINQVKTEYSINNELSLPLVKSVDLIYTGDISQDKGYAISFVWEHFVSSYEEEEQVLVGTTPEGEPKYETKTTTVYYFVSSTEMLDKVQQPPYSFKEQDVQMVQELFLDMEGGLGMAYEGKYPMPVQGYISSGYGNRYDPLNGEYFLHPAVDIVPVWHSPIISIADGEVTEVVTDSIYGNNVTIKHMDGNKIFYTFSAHLSRVDVTLGQMVGQGQVVGLEGGDQKLDPNPGRTTGHHLHFEVWETPSRSGSVNPAKYLKG